MRNIRDRLTLAAALSIGVVDALGAAGGEPAMRYEFGPGKAKAGVTRVLADTAYSWATGYGFDLGSRVTCVGAGEDGAVKRGVCASDRSFFFSVNLTEGNYRVVATFGDSKARTLTTVKAESRRLMVERVETRAGRFETRTFTVNVRNSQITGGGAVRLKDREIGVLHWDDKLTLEFGNDHPALAALEITRVSDAVTVYLAGDSTVTDQTTEPWAAWGQMLPRFFGPSVSIANHAESGESLKSFVSENRLAKLLTQMRAGDYLFVQFTHNDQKPGPNYVEPFTGYKEHMRLFIGEARKRGVTPVLVTSMLRRNFDDNGKIVNTLGEYPEALRQVAREERVALIDLCAASRAFYEALGPEGSKKAFVHYAANTFPGQDQELKDDTHFNNYGAYELARAVVEGIKANVPALARHLTRNIPAFDPSHPDPPSTWTLPATPGPR